MGFQRVPPGLRPATRKRRRPTRRLGGEFLESRHLLATFTVTTTADLADIEQLTLAEAIRLANASQGPDDIVFELSSQESEALDPTVPDSERVFVFRLTRPLPELSDPTGGTTIDGNTQAVSDDGTNRAGPEIVLDGSALEFATALVLASDANTIRGLNITNFSGDGIQVRGNDCVVAGNFIGTRADGMQAAGNESGIVVFGDNNQIGDSSPGGFNLVAGNRNHGVVLFGSNNRVINNFIGVTADGRSALGNAEDGISISNAAFNNQVGDASLNHGNTIAFNGRNGITVAVNEEGAAQNRLRGNSIHSNQALGIDLTESSAAPDGVTPNDTNVLDGTLTFDMDQGANGLQNFPVLTQALAGQTFRVQGSLQSHTDQLFTVDFYANGQADESGFGEGQQYLGSAMIRTDSAGQGTIDREFDSEVGTTKFVTATATDDQGNTSEFSAAVRITEARSISGRTFRDLAGDGFSEDDVPGFGITIELYRELADLAAGNPDPVDGTLNTLVTTTQTLDDGSYRFDDLPPAVYRVAERVDPTLLQTAGGNLGNAFYTIDLRPGTDIISSTDNDFANFLLVTLQGVVWQDLLGDGHDDGDIPRAGVIVELFRDDGDGVFDASLDDRLQSSESDSQGRFEFSGLPPGDFFIVPTPDLEAIQTFGGDSFPQVSFFTVDTRTSNVPTDFAFGQFETVELGGTAFHDQSGDGVSPDDPPLAGVVMQLYQDQGNGRFDEEDTLFAFTTTNDQGGYQFDGIGPGVYFVQQTVPEGFQQTDGGSPGGLVYDVRPQSGRNQPELDFASAALPLLTGTIWDDHNLDALVSDGERALAGWTVNITDSANHTIQTQTDELGRYSISVAPGDYTVTEVLPTDWEPTFPLGRFQTHQAVAGGVMSSFALLADIDDDAALPGVDAVKLPELIVGHDTDTPGASEGSLWIYRNPGNGDFTANAEGMVRLELGADTRPRAAVAADFDADGDLDLAVAAVGRRRTGGGPKGSVIIVRNDNGQLQIDQVLTVGESWPADGPIDLAVADVDNDGTLDLTTVDFRSHTVSLLKGLGDGHFQVTRVMPSSGLAPRAIKALDVDGDGVVELIVAEYGSNRVVVLGATPAGTYQPVYWLDAVRPTDVSVADVDGDNLPDLLVAASDGVTVFWNGVKEPFTEHSQLLAGMRAQAIALGDLNGDQIIDVVVTNPDSAQLGLVLNRGRREFAAAVEFRVTGSNATAGVSPQTIAIADVDGDGDLDLATGLVVGGACVLTNHQGGYAVDVNYGQTVDRLDFGNYRVAPSPLKATVATISLEDDPAPIVNEDSWPATESRTIALSGTNVLDSAAGLDVSHDGLVTPLDALLVVNQLNDAARAHDLLLDTNRDGYLSPLDALLIINYLNALTLPSISDIAAAQLRLVDAPSHASIDKSRLVVVIPEDA